jgi:hypothetical protein
MSVLRAGDIDAISHSARILTYIVLSEQVAGMKDNETKVRFMELRTQGSRWQK